MHNDHNIKSPPDFNGQSPIIKKTTKNTKPKLRFDDIFISECANFYEIFFANLKPKKSKVLYFGRKQFCRFRLSPIKEKVQIIVRDRRDRKNIQKC